MEEEVLIKKTNKLKEFLKRVFVHNIALKAIALLVGFIAWFCVQLV